MWPLFPRQSSPASPVVLPDYCHRQIDNVLGVQTPPAENALEKVLYYVLHPPYPDWHTLLVAAVVVATMLILPRLTSAIPGSLVGLVLASLLTAGMQWSIPVIGEIPAPSCWIST